MRGWLTATPVVLLLCVMMMLLPHQNQKGKRHPRSPPANNTHHHLFFPPAASRPATKINHQSWPSPKPAPQKKANRHGQQQGQQRGHTHTHPHHPIIVVCCQRRNCFFFVPALPLSVLCCVVCVCVVTLSSAVSPCSVLSLFLCCGLDLLGWLAALSCRRAVTWHTPTQEHRKGTTQQNKQEQRGKQDDDVETHQVPWNGATQEGYRPPITLLHSSSTTAGSGEPPPLRWVCLVVVLLRVPCFSCGVVCPPSLLSLSFSPLSPFLLCVWGCSPFCGRRCCCCCVLVLLGCFLSCASPLFVVTRTDVWLAAPWSRTAWDCSLKRDVYPSQGGIQTWDR